MVGSMERSEVVALKNQGFSNREVARRTGLNREIVSKYWTTYQHKKNELLKSDVDIKQVQDDLVMIAVINNPIHTCTLPFTIRKIKNAINSIYRIICKLFFKIQSL